MNSAIRSILSMARPRKEVFNDPQAPEPIQQDPEDLTPYEGAFQEYKALHLQALRRVIDAAMDAQRNPKYDPDVNTVLNNTQHLPYKHHTKLFNEASKILVEANYAYAQQRIVMVLAGENPDKEKLTLGGSTGIGMGYASGGVTGIGGVLGAANYQNAAAQQNLAQYQNAAAQQNMAGLQNQAALQNQAGVFTPERYTITPYLP